MRGSRRSLIALSVALLVVLPWVLPQGLLNASIQMLIAGLFACAYNLLSGQAGMLSFGHAAYFGVGAFATVHAMNAFGGAGLLPTPLLPVAGAVAGAGVGLVAGWFATQRTGAYFAMITLAVAELLHALAPHFKPLFGGEAGVSAMRMPSMGLTFGSTTQVYYLVLTWVLGSVLALYLFTRTPLGSATLGLRENSHRLRFLGYRVHRLSVMVFSISALFSGVAGSLQVVNNEAANYIVFDAGQSAAVVLNAYIGGTRVFLGPAAGAAVMTFFGYAVSDLTQSWLLYQGFLFALVMMFVPSGFTGLLGMAARVRRRFGTARSARFFALAGVAAILLTAGTVFLVELLQRLFSHDYRALAGAARSWPPVPLFGREWWPAAPFTWLWPVMAFGAGAVSLQAARRRLALLECAQEGEVAEPVDIESGRSVG